MLRPFICMLPLLGSLQGPERLKREARTAKCAPESILVGDGNAGTAGNIMLVSMNATRTATLVCLA